MNTASLIETDWSNADSSKVAGWRKQLKQNIITLSQILLTDTGDYGTTHSED